MTLADIERKLLSPLFLPGHKAFSLLELNRPEPKEKDLQQARKAAVAVIITLQNQVPKILFIKRASYKGVHSSQMAFPGGKLEHTDSSLLHCAIRETKEEIGLDLANVTPVKTLSPVFIPPSNFLVQPFVFLLPTLDDNQLILQASEVQSIHYLAVENLLLPNPFSKKTLELERGSLTTKGLNLDNEFVWGASAAMLAEVHYILTKP